MAEQAKDLSGIASVISSITSDPEMMDKLRSAVGGAQKETSAEPPRAAVVPVDPEGGAPSVKWSGADRRRLLEALRPFLSAERREKADSLINVIALLDSGIIEAVTKGGR
ncbi:MAG: hypothetical protein IJR90_03765 [Clostridia bacterium]|nr:hypothetical protein [Clostridia bacterium]